MDHASILDKRAKEIEQEYLSSLADLNVNSKPLINMLTILAEENLEYAQIIVAAVEEHLSKVTPDVKLPILYLVDSIVKNVGKQYQSLFSQVIVNMFCCVFETVNEKIREKMFSLRQTWNEVFPQSKLYALDIKINSMDPGWPITAQLKPKIHVNPMFLKSTHVPEPPMTVHQQLRDKHRELLELQARKLELELLTTKKRIEEQEKQLSLQTASVAKETPLEVRRTLENVGPTGAISVAGGGIISTTLPTAGLPKSRIAPVSQSMINMVKTRDPRLAKQQAAAQLVAVQPSGMTMGSNHALGTPGSMTVPPPVIVPGGTMEAPNHAPPKASSVSVKERLGARVRVRRLDPVSGSSSSRLGSAIQENCGRGKKPSSSSSIGSSSSHKSRHEHDVKSRKDRKEHSSSSSSSTSGRLSARGGSSGKTSSSSSRAASESGAEKRKQRTQSNSDSSPQGRKSPHSPGKKKSTSDKSNHSSDGTSRGGDKPRLESKGSSANCGKVARQARSNSSDGRKHEHPTNDDQQSANNNDAQDVDLRFSIPEKRMKIDESTLKGRRSMEADEKMPTVRHKASEVKNNSATDDEEAVSAMIAKDIDLRSIPHHSLPNKRVAKELELEPLSASSENASVLNASKESPIKRSDEGGDSDEFTGGKKRSSSNKSDEPTAKKSKAEMIDALFGNEDVDLRQLPIVGKLLEAPPPPTISEENQGINSSKLDNDTPRSPLSEKNGGNRLEAVRAKLAEASKSQEKDKLGRPLLYNKLPDDPIERRRSISSLAKPGDIDLRHLQHHDCTLDQDDDNSMDSMNSNIKTIIAQAQEQMDKGEITPEQYNILMKQVIQLNETQKIRQAQRIEHGKRQDPPVIRIDDNGSLSDEDDVIVTSVTPGAIVRSKDCDSGASTAGNDFRGKIFPMDGKTSLGKPFDAPFSSAVVPLTSVPPPEIRAQRDPRRQRESKWNRVEPNTAWANRPGTMAPNVVGGSSLTVSPLAGGIRAGAPMAVPSPWELAPFPVAGAPRFPVVPTLPSIGIGPGPGAVSLNGQPSSMRPKTKMNDSVRTINIDGIQREIRFYEETAVIFMNWDDPKEIGFQKGARMIVVDDRETFELGFNEPYKSVSIENNVYQMRLGAPTRELYIDDSWYECYFGDAPTTIFLGGKPRIFKIAGPAPQVKIGDSRNDLVTGKINMIVDAEYIIPVFLDCKVQSFEINGHVHKLQFADFLLTVLIDEQPYPVDFGKLPKVYPLRERDYYIRFTSLPHNVQPGNVYIRDMIRTPLYRDLRTPPKDPSAIILPDEVNDDNLPFGQTAALGLGMPLSLGAFGGLNKTNHPLPPSLDAQHATGTTSTVSTGLDYLTNIIPPISMQPGSKNIAGYRIEADEKASTGGGNVNTTTPGIPLLANINVEELYKKIVAAGIITKLGTGSGNAPSSSSPTPGIAGNDGNASIGKPTKDDLAKTKDKDNRLSVVAIVPVLLDKPETLKKRQAAIVHQLFSGMQCSSCGVRFPPEQTMKYSQHLDWHFRQNRRDRDSARKAHSRKWYYDVSDWIQYEEIEDLEEREKNWFETQQTELCDLKKGGIGAGGGSGGGVGGADGDDSSPNADGTPQPSCPAGSDEDDRQCHMCHEVFEQFYNEETEEWHLKCAIRIDGSTYHPLCYEDYKASLTMSETTLGGASFDSNQKTDTTMDLAEGELEGEGSGNGDTDKRTKKKSHKADGTEGSEDDDEDDDVIVLPTVEPVVEEIFDDDADESAAGSPGSHMTANGDPDKDEEVAATASKSPLQRQPEFQERQIDEDLFIQEPNIEVTDLDEIEDKPPGTPNSPVVGDTDGAGEAGTENSLSSLLRVKIKEEPKEDDDADEEDALFEDVGTIESSLLETINHQSPVVTYVDEDLYDNVVVDSIPSPSETSNQMASIQTPAPKPSLDGNVELQDAPQAVAVAPNRIKINITKSKAASFGGGLQNSSHVTPSTNEADNSETHGGATVDNNINEDSQSVVEGSEEVPPSAGAAGKVMFDELSHGGVGIFGDEGEEKNKDTSATAAAVPAEVVFEETTDVAYELKEGLRGVDFNRQPRVTNGCEASGLCSIM